MINTLILYKLLALCLYHGGIDIPESMVQIYISGSDVIPVSEEENEIRDQAYIIKQVNRVRSQACQCGSERMKAVNAVRWNPILERTALKHAKQMSYYDFFSHRSLDGKNIGERLDAEGYRWRYAGENIAEGQKSFDEVLRDWIKSPTHCKMLMNPNMEEMGVAKVGSYWVQHFGTKMPDKTVRKKIYYREG